MKTLPSPERLAVLQVERALQDGSVCRSMDHFSRQAHPASARRGLGRKRIAPRSSSPQDASVSSRRCRRPIYVDFDEVTDLLDSEDLKQ